MHINRKKAATNHPLNQGGFTLLQVIVVIALVAILSVFSAMGIVNARARMRLAASARTFAGFAEKARTDSVRRHAMTTDRASLRLLTTTSYSVSLDFDGNGVLNTYDTKTFNLEPNVTWQPEYVGTTITFDWRGRSVTGQVNPVLLLRVPASNSAVLTSALITISGSGDITMDSESFPDGSIPDVVLTGTPSGDIRPDPPSNPLPIGATPTPVPTPTPTPDPNATPTPYPTPVPTPTPVCHGSHCDATPTPTPIPTPAPSPSPSPSPSPTRACTLTGPASITLANRATVAISLAVANSSGNTTVSVANDNPSHISVTLAPGQTGIVNINGTVIFNATMNGNNQTGTLVFSAGSPCGASATVNVNHN